MPDATEEQVATLVDDLDRAVPRETARVRLSHTHKPMGYTLTANREGFIRLAVELLRASAAPGVAKPHSSEIFLEANLDYLACRSTPLIGDPSLRALVRDDEVDVAVPLPAAPQAAATPPARDLGLRLMSKLMGAAFVLFGLAAVLGFLVVALVVIRQLR